MKSTTSMRRAAWTTLPVLLFSVAGGDANAAPAPTVTASIYTSMPSTTAHSPEMAMDGSAKSYFKSVYDMNDEDTFMVIFTNPIPIRSLRIQTGDPAGKDAVTAGTIETSPDIAGFTKAGDFDPTGVASANLGGALVKSIRIRLNPHASVPSLFVREITISSPVKIKSVQQGAPRGFVDFSQAPDVADWAKRSETEMDGFWPKIAYILRSDGFITPNMVNMIFKDAEGVAGTDNGVMTVNADWARKHDDDTGLAVHEVTHVIQATPYEPVWMVEGIADYIRWVKFEPEHFHPRINVEKSHYNDSYQTTATFLGWCENHYDDGLVTKLNDAVRFGKYNDALFKTYCGKDVSTLWAEFIADYKADPSKILAKPGA